MQAEKLLPGFATFMQEQEPGPGCGAWSGDHKDLSEATRTQGRAAGNNARRNQLNYTRNNTSSRCWGTLSMEP